MILTDTFICKSCKERLSIDYRSRYSKLYCEACASERVSPYQTITDDNKKKCCHCNKFKLLDEFYRDSKAYSGYQSLCKLCVYYSNNYSTDNVAYFSCPRCGESRKQHEFVDVQDNHIIKKYRLCMTCREIEQQKKDTALSEEMRLRTLYTKYLDKDGVTKPDFGYIYIFESGFTQLIKIGCSKKPQNRFSSLKTIDATITPIHCFPALDYKACEQSIHKFFSSQRKTGEWFSLSEKDITLLKNIKEMRELKGGGKTRILAHR